MVDIRYRYMLLPFSLSHGSSFLCVDWMNASLLTFIPYTYFLLVLSARRTKHLHRYKQFPYPFHVPCSMYLTICSNNNNKCRFFIPLEMVIVIRPSPMCIVYIYGLSIYFYVYASMFMFFLFYHSDRNVYCSRKKLKSNPLSGRKLKV